MDTKGTQVRGFTLIELLVVIAIIAILAAVVVLTLNPAELLKQSRDTTRLSDLANINSALAIYLADTTSPNLGNHSLCYVFDSDPTAQPNPNCTTRFTAGATVNSSSSRAIDGTGWIPVDLTGVSAGAPLPQYPVDPVNDDTYFYAYRPGPVASGTFEINAKLESVKFSNGGSDDKESRDGGDNANLYEVGNVADNL